MLIAYSRQPIHTAMPSGLYTAIGRSSRSLTHNVPTHKNPCLTVWANTAIGRSSSSLTQRPELPTQIPEKSLLDRNTPQATPTLVCADCAYIEMSFTVLFVPSGGVAAGCHSSNSQAAGGTHTCAILDGGGVKCWGSGLYGQLGYDSMDDKGDAAGEMAGLGTVSLGASAIAITAGVYHTCAILDGGSVKCWGTGQYGRLGYTLSSRF